MERYRHQDVSTNIALGQVIVKERGQHRCQAAEVVVLELMEDPADETAEEERGADAVRGQREPGAVGAGTGPGQRSAADIADRGRDGGKLLPAVGAEIGPLPAASKTPFGEQQVKRRPREAGDGWNHVAHRFFPRETRTRLSRAGVVRGPVHDRLVDVDVAVPDFQIIPAFRIGADPSLIANCGTLAPEVRQGHQVTGIALLTFRETCLFHGVLLPTDVS